jgi:anti-sigma factor RsiW
MTGRIIPLHGDDHLEAQSLLPWYVTGRLEGAERAQVEAHLNVCAECQDDVKFERRLHAEIAALPVGVETGWTEMRRRMANDRRSARRETVSARLLAVLRAAGQRWGGEHWRGWALAAPAVLVLFVAALALPGARPHPYHALAATRGVAPVGNALVIFRPDTPERDLRAALEAGRARLVDGPTAADAYVIRIPAGKRLAVLAQLRGRADVELAEPIDAGESP